MLETARLVLEQECQLRPGQVVLVGVSGGPDSLCLLDLLERAGYPVVVAHLHHGIRLQADVDAQAVRQFAAQRRLRFVLGREDIPAYAAANSLSIEEAARIVRYRFLFEEAAKASAQAVAVGHTADDQVETVLMHLLRGAGLSGLRGMAYRAFPNAWSREIPLVRPLLGVWRRQVVEYCSERGLQPVQDESNLDTTYYRNRLRHELFPFLETYNPAIRQALWRMADTLAADYAVLDWVVDQAWQESLAEMGTGYLAFRIAALVAQPLAVQRHLLRRAIACLRPGLRDVDYESVELAISFLRDPRQTLIDLTAGLRMLRETGTLWLSAWETDLPTVSWPQMPGDEQISLPVQGEVRLAGGWRLSVMPLSDVAAAESEALANTDPYQAWVAVDDLQTPLILRGRRQGERFRPLGLEGHSIKLSEFMINVKMPGRARPVWPLVCGQYADTSGQEVVWVPGYRLGHPFRLTKNTRKAVALRVWKE